MIGDVPNVQVGQEYSTRKLAAAAGVHRPFQAGICGTKKDGAESIVVSGGYKDDQDFGEVIVYTGHGGRDESGNQVSDQSLDDSGNAALVTSHLEGLPVRVVRGAHRASPYAPLKGYRYDGLYRVTSYGSTQGIDGFVIWQFRLEAYEGTPTPDTVQQALPIAGSTSAGGSKMQPPAGNDTPERVTTSVQRIVRSSAVKRQVKEWHDHACQVCGLTVELPGGKYSEGAHIQALGSPHNGPDTTDNVLCLCPTCHVLFDGGAIVLTDDLVIVRDGKAGEKLRTSPKHGINPSCVALHRERWRQ
ncbi:HNH endonuclease [Streptomyces sp. MT29]|nr:HNH endonuclease [Streptomyces sp. MT29]